MFVCAQITRPNGTSSSAARLMSIKIESGLRLAIGALSSSLPLTRLAALWSRTWTLPALLKLATLVQYSKRSAHWVGNSTKDGLSS